MQNSKYWMFVRISLTLYKVETNPPEASGETVIGLKITLNNFFLYPCSVLHKPESAGASPTRKIIEDLAHLEPSLWLIRGFDWGDVVAFDVLVFCGVIWLQSKRRAAHASAPIYIDITSTGTGVTNKEIHPYAAIIYDLLCDS